MSRSLIFNQFGHPADVLKIGEVEKNQLETNEVRVKMDYSPINPSDILPIRGAYSHRTILPAIPGYEGIGKIIEVGSSVSKSRVGQRVLPLRGEGLWQEDVKCNADFAIPVPERINSLVASQLYINPLTAWVLCKEILKVQKGQIIAINAANSSFGRIMIQLSKLLGFHLIAVVRKEKYIDELRALGAMQVVKLESKKSFLKLSDWEIDAAVDLIGGTSGTNLASSVKIGGIFRSIGLLSGKQVDWNKISTLPINSGLFHLRYWNEKQSVESWQRSLNEILDLVSSKKIALNSDFQIFSFEEVKNALTEYEKGSQGKIILSF